MKDEIKRVSALIRLGLDPPYYTEYRVEDTVSHSITASLGALVEEERFGVSRSIRRNARRNRQLR